MKNTTAFFLAGWVFLCSGGQASAMAIDYYCESTSDMLFKLDWRIHEGVKQTLRTVGATEVPQIQECYRAANVENETRKVFDDPEHELKRHRMNNISAATHKAIVHQRVLPSLLKEVPDRDDNLSGFNSFVVAALNETEFTSGDRYLNAAPADTVLVTQEAMSSLHLWCTSPTFLANTPNLDSESMLDDFGDDEGSNFAFWNILDLLVGPQNQHPSDPADILSRGKIHSTVAQVADLGAGVQEALEALGVENVPAAIEIDASQAVYRFPVVTQFRTRDFKSCVTANTWDDVRTMDHWPNRWCFKKPGEASTYLGLPKHSYAAPICECLDQFETSTFMDNQTEYRGISLDPWGFAVASITNNEYQANWKISYKLYAENPTLVRALVRLPNGDFSGYLPLAVDETNSHLAIGSINLRDALALDPGGLDPLFTYLVLC